MRKRVSFEAGRRRPRPNGHQSKRDIDGPSLTSQRQRLVTIGWRLLKNARYYWVLLAETHLTRRLFGAMVRRIEALPVPTA